LCRLGRDRGAAATEHDLVHRCTALVIGPPSEGVAANAACN
jgi:hypothetical protein